MSVIHPELAERELHLLARPLGPGAYDPQAVAAAWHLLNAEERQRAVSCHGDHLRNDFIVGRGMLRVLLAQYVTDTPPHALYFIRSAKGKPGLDPTKHPNAPAFSVSHCANLLLIGVAHSCEQFGVDVEALRPGPDDALALEVLSAREHAEYSATPRIRRASKFLHFWTRKEAYLKAVGTGLIDDLSSIDTSQDEVVMAEKPTGLFCRSLPVDRGFRAAFASRNDLKVILLSEISM
jgi:4'-phosphopantetheinyl transferase